MNQQTILESTRDVVLYDGNCSFCDAQVRRLRQLDRRGRLSFLSLHDEQTEQRFPELSHEQLMQEMHLVDRHGRCHRGAAAFRYLTRRLPALWPLMPLLHIPFSLPVWQWLYQQIAKRRYRLSGLTCQGGSCSLNPDR